MPNFRRYNHKTITRNQQRIQRQRLNRRYRRHVPINALNIITQLPLQITNDQFANFLFNEGSFY